MEIIGYTYEAGIHCVSCAQVRFKKLDEKVRDREDNQVMPIFTTDDMSECGESCEDCGSWVSTPVQHDAGTCGLADSCRKFWQDFQ
jgi:hypothetical protein